jgi:hypothetical protein
MFRKILADIIITYLATKIDDTSIEQRDKLAAHNFLQIIQRAFYSVAGPKLGKSYASIIEAKVYDDISQPQIIRLIEATLLKTKFFQDVSPIFLSILSEARVIFSKDEVDRIKQDLSLDLNMLEWPKSEILDLRHYQENTTRSDRFLTYIACLLRFPSNLSACTALTVANHLVDEGLQLYVSCNLADAKDETRATLLSQLYARLRLIEAYVKDIHEKPEEMLFALSSSSDGAGAAAASFPAEDEGDLTALSISIPMPPEPGDEAIFSPSPMGKIFSDEKHFVFTDEDKPQWASEFATEPELESRINLLGRDLIQRLGYTSSEMLKLDSKWVRLASKVIYTLCFDHKHEILPETVQELFLNLSKAIVLLPRIELIAPTSSTRRLVADIFSGIEFPKINLLSQQIIFDLVRLPQKYLSINLIHAEQLLVYALNILGRRPDVVGISFLCCFTCADVMTKYGVKFYGAHQKTTEGVLNFFKLQPQTPDGTRFFPVRNSPKITPMRSEAAARLVSTEEDSDCLGLPPKIKRFGGLLFSLTSAPDHSKVPSLLASFRP